MVTTVKKSMIPDSLRRLPKWFLTGDVEWAPNRFTKRRYSCTLGELRWDQPEDFVDFDEALQVGQDTFWIDGFGLKITKPLIVMIALDALEPNGRVSKHFRPLADEIGGFWERRANGSDVLGILEAETSVPHTGLGHTRNGFLVHVSDCGVAYISGQAISGLARDPVMTDMGVLARFFSQTRWDSAWVEAKVAERNRRLQAKRATQSSFEFGD